MMSVTGVDDSAFVASDVGVGGMLADHVFNVDSVMDGMLGVGSIGHTNIHRTVRATPMPNATTVV